MGAKVSRVVGRFLRKPLETERRLNKVLDSKPVSAPRHPTSKDFIDKMSSESKEEFKMRDSKDDQFLKALKDFKIDSKDIKEGIKPLSKPQEAQVPQSDVPELAKGKVTSQKLNELFQYRLQAPTEWTEQKIADHYELNKDDVECLLKYFSGYAVIQKRVLPTPLQRLPGLIE